MDSQWCTSFAVSWNSWLKTLDLHPGILVRLDLVLAAAWNIVQYIAIPIICYVHSASKRVCMVREKVF